MTRTRPTPLLGSFLVLAGAVIVAQPRRRPLRAIRSESDDERRRRLHARRGSGCIIARPCLRPRARAVGKIIHDADAACGNSKGPQSICRGRRPCRQAEFGGVWIIGSPSRGQDLRRSGSTSCRAPTTTRPDWGLEGMRQTSRP